MQERSMTEQEIIARTAERRAACDQLKEVLVERLDLPIDPLWITDDQPLFGRGLELDSVDSLELAVGVDDVAEVSITDEEIGLFGSVNRVIDYIEAHGDHVPDPITTDGLA